MKKYKTGSLGDRRLEKGKSHTSPSYILGTQVGEMSFSEAVPTQPEPEPETPSRLFHWEHYLVVRALNAVH